MGDTTGVRKRIKKMAVSAAYLAGPEDDAVVVLLAVVLVLLQLLPPQAHRHGAQTLVHPQVVPVLWEPEHGQQGQHTHTHTHTDTDTDTHTHTHTSQPFSKAVTSETEDNYIRGTKKGQNLSNAEKDYKVSNLLHFNELHCVTQSTVKTIKTLIQGHTGN